MYIDIMSTYVLSGMSASIAGIILTSYLGTAKADFGKELKVGDKIDVPDIGTVEVMPNIALDPNAYTAEDSGVVLLPERAEFTAENVDNYNF